MRYVKLAFSNIIIQQMGSCKNILSLFLDVTILKLNPEGKILKVVLNTKEGFEPSEFKTIYSLFSPEEEVRLMRLLESHIQIKKKFVKLNKKTGLEEFVDVEIVNEKAEIYFFIQFFSSQREREVLYDRYVEKLAAFSRKDPMTKILNRQGLFEQLRFLVKNSDSEKRIGLIYIDIDNLKEINDNYGHVMGDEAILHISKLLRTTFRKRDLLTRWGGDEFMAIVEEVTGSQSGTYSLSERLYDLVNKAYDGKGTSTVSLGVHIFEAGKLTKNIDNFDDFRKVLMEEVSHADKASYAAKAGGKNQIAVSEGFKKYYKLKR